MSSSTEPLTPQELEAFAERLSRHLAIPIEQARIDAANQADRRGPEYVRQKLSGDGGKDQEKKPPPQVDIVLWRDFELDREDHDLIEGGLVEDRGLHYIIGPPGAAKTFFALGMGGSLASGRDFLGRRTRQCGVYYVAAERPDSVMLRSFALRDLVGANIPFAMIRSRVDLTNAEWLSALAGELLKHREQAMGDMPPKVLIIDTLAAASPGLDENNGSQTSRVVGNLVELGNALQCSVVVVHHTGKDESRGLRGHSNQLGRADQETTLERRKDKDGNKLNIFTVKISKNRDGEDGTTIAFRLVPEKIGETRSGKPIETCRIELIESLPEPEKNKSKRITLTDRAMDELRNVVVDAGVERGPNKDIPQVVRAVTIDQFRERLVRVGIVEKSDAGRKAWERLRHGLMSRKDVRILDSYIWGVTP